jgi:hypothetical protein
LAAGALVATATLVVSAAAEVLLAATRPAGGWQAGEAEAVVFIGGALVVAAATVVAIAAAARSRLVGALPRERGRRDPRATLIADITALSTVLGRVATRVLAYPRLTAFVVAATACIAVTVTQALAHDFAHHASVVIGAAVVGTLEGVAVAVCYLAFGRALGLRSAGSSLTPAR